MAATIQLTQQQVDTARWVADHSTDELFVDIPVVPAQTESTEASSTILLRFERSPIDSRWVLVTPVTVIPGRRIG